MSVAAAIADAIVTAVGTLGWKKPDGVTSVPVVKRKKPDLPSDKEPFQVVVCVGDIVTCEALTARKDLVTRNVAVAIVKDSGKATGDDEDFRDRLEAIRVKVNAKATFAGVSGFNRIDPTKDAPYDKAALKADLNFGVEFFRIETLEDRS